MDINTVELSSITADSEKFNTKGFDAAANNSVLYKDSSGLPAWLTPGTKKLLSTNSSGHISTTYLDYKSSGMNDSDLRVPTSANIMEYKRINQGDSNMDHSKTYAVGDNLNSDSNGLLLFGQGLMNGTSIQDTYGGLLHLSKFLFGAASGVYTKLYVGGNNGSRWLIDDLADKGLYVIKGIIGMLHSYSDAAAYGEIEALVVRSSSGALTLLNESYTELYNDIGGTQDVRTVVENDGTNRYIDIEVDTGGTSYAMGASCDLLIAKLRL